PAVRGVGALPGCDCHAAPFLGLDVADGLRELPPVPARVFDEDRALAVDVRRRLLEGTRARRDRAREGGVDVLDLELDQLRHDAAARCDLVASDVRDDDRAVRPEAKLRSMVVADAHALAESERSFEE